MTTARTTDMTGDHALDNYFCLADGRVSAYSTEPSTTTMDTIIVICEFPILYLCRVHLMRRRPRITKVPRSEYCARTWSPFLSGFYHGIACSHHYQQVGLHLRTFQTETPLTCSEWNFDQFLFAHLFLMLHYYRHRVGWMAIRWRSRSGGR